MQIKWNTLLLAAIAGILSLGGAQASDHSYHNNVSDIEVEDAVKGETYNKGPTSFFGGDKKECSACSACSACAAQQSGTEVQTTAATTTTTAAVPASGDGRHIKYILDGKPVYEEGAKGETGDFGAMCAPGAVLPGKTAAVAAPKPAASAAEISAAIENLGNAGWRDAQAFLIQAGKTAVPYLIDALGKPGIAYNLAGHTKADAGRAPRQLTIADVCAQLLEELVTNHSNYAGEVPGANQQAWQDWWSKNGQSVAFGS